MTTGPESATQCSLSDAYFEKYDVSPTRGDHVLLLRDTMVYPRDNILTPCFEMSLLHRPWGNIFDPVLCDEIGFKELSKGVYYCFL